MEDCCAVCAEPLEWVAFGKCGHKDACSKCVTRLRFVLKDNRCVICQQLLQIALVTRHLGSYTKSLSPAEFEELQKGVAGKHYHQLRSVDAFFDDKVHFQEIRKLCSYTHPVLTELEQGSGNEQQPPLKSLGALKKALQLRLQLHFCDLCLENRKVFIPEQILYTKADLARHQKTGDAEGVLAESGFKGHPLCRFCNKRFFGENELFFHMQQAHEQCHICKKAHPDRFEYFCSYNELEAPRKQLHAAEHYRHEHFLCGHPSCLERKFVVFASEQELKQHTAREHSGTMSRAERRQALTIPINIQFSRRPVEEERRGRGRQGGRLREPDPQQLATALQASMDMAQRNNERAEAPRNQSQRQSGGAKLCVLEDSEFPSMGGSNAAVFAVGGYGTAATRGNAPKTEDFPALPGTSKAAKRRQKEKEKEQARSLAERVGRPGETEVLNSGRPAVMGQSREDAFPALGHSNSAPQLASSRTASPGPQWQASSRNQANVAPAATAMSTAAPDFPSLLHSKHPSETSSPRPAVPSRLQGSGARSCREDDFPALCGLERPAPVTSAAVHLKEATNAQGRRISEGLKAANKALIEKIKRQLGPIMFTEFRQEAGKFMSGAIDAETYHREVASLGLASLIPEMASLLPEPLKRAELLSVHETARALSSGRGWVAPKAAAVALKSAKTQASWQCPGCSLINEPRAGTCEACRTKRPMNDLAALSRASSSGGMSSAAAAAEEEDRPYGGKQKKVPKFERLRLTSGGADPAIQAEIERRTKPGNAWTHRHTLGSAAQPPAQKNAWNGPGNGKLAGQISGLQNAWAKQ